MLRMLLSLALKPLSARSLSLVDPGVTAQHEYHYRRRIDRLGRYRNLAKPSLEVPRVGDSREIETNALSVW